jgi:hypothetical protein
MAAAVALIVALVFAAGGTTGAVAASGKGAKAEKRIACINAAKGPWSDRGRGYRSRFRACMANRW